jgi:hypothetical protein
VSHGQWREEIPGTLCGKVMGEAPGNSTGFSIRFTSVPPEIEALLRGLTASVVHADEKV